MPFRNLIAHYCWVGSSSVRDEVCPTLLHMTGGGNRTYDPWIYKILELTTQPGVPMCNKS